MRGTGSQCEARGVIPAPPLFVLYFARATGDEAANLNKLIVCLFFFLGCNTPRKELKTGKTRYEYGDAEDKRNQVTE